MFDRCIYFNTSALARQLDRVWTKAFAPFGLTPPQAFMLRAVLDRPGMLQSELAETLQIARATATRALDGLAGKALVERRSTRHDRRECEIHPTAEALALKADINAASAAVTREIKAKVGDARFADMVEMVKSINAELA